MARIRTIKPEFAHSESMGNVSRDARLLFVLLWSQSDDEGKQRGSPRLLNGVLFPYDDDVASGQIETWLAELARENCIERYEVDGAHYLRIVKWRDHQKIDRPAASKFPDPPGPAAPPCEDSLFPREASSDTREPSSHPREASSDAREPSSTDQGSRKGPGPGPKDRGPKEQEPDQGRAPKVATTTAAAAALPVAVSGSVPVPSPGPGTTDPPETEAYRHWQEIARLEGWPEVGFLNSHRRLQLQARLGQCGGIEGWKLAIQKARDAEFLRKPGGVPQPWFDLDWLLDERKFTKVMENRYAERHRNDSKPGDILSALASYGREDDR